MEKISAAYAMEWSIELEKGLRSKKPGQSLEAILQLGSRLEQWNREPELTITEYNIFGLIPGEDRLFASTVLLRLADAFKSGDKAARMCIVRVFLSVLRHSGRNSAQNYGILSKHRISNQKELLRRIKTVLFTGDIESRALALVLFGCWADFAIDSADVRYLILSGLVSCHDLEVRASLFSAGCFCTLSDDFASLVLEMLVKITVSLKTSPAVRLAAVRAFAKLGCSFPLATKVYKAGVKLVRESLKEDPLVAMLISLSKIASKMTFLMSEQVDLLVSFFTSEATLPLKAVALKCLHFLFRRGVHSSPLSSCSITTLFSMLDTPELQCDALHILHKILSYNLSSLPCLDMLECPKLLKIVENADQYPIMSMRILAIRSLIAISDRFRETEIGPDGVCTPPLYFQVISLVFDRINLLTKFALDLHQTDSELEGECRNLLKLLLLLVKHHPDLGVFVMDKIIILMESLANVVDKVTGTRQLGLSTYVIEGFKGENGALILMKLAFYIYKFVVACLENLSEGRALVTQVLCKAKIVAEHVCHCSLFDCYTRSIYSLLLHYLIIHDFLVNGEKDTYFFNGESGICLNNYMADQEVIALECANELLAGNNNWFAYRAGRFAACQGAWCTAALIFGKLVTIVESDSCRFWLKSLAQFAHSEMEFKLLLLNKGSCLEVNKQCLMPCSGQLGVSSFSSCSEKLAGVCGSIRSSGETLGSMSDQGFCFQRWIMALRANVLESVVDVLKTLGTLPFNLDCITTEGQTDGSIIVKHSRFPQAIDYFVYHFAQISSRLKRLAQEFDLIATSFIDMDRESSKIISALALGCSVLAFSIGFTLFIPNVPPCNNFAVCSSENLEANSHAMLIRNLINRLWHLDPETSVNLRMLMKTTGQSKKCTHMRSRNQLLGISCETSDVLSVCSFAVREFVGLQNEASTVHNKQNLPRVTQGFKVLSNVIEKWMHIPFQIPKYFFRVRPCVGSELFAFNECSRDGDGISISSGFQLSLDLCLQLKNMPADLVARQTKLYCILDYRKSFLIPEPHVEDKEQSPQGFQAWETDSIVGLNERLFQYVTECAGEDGISRCCRNGGSGDEDVSAFVCFKPNGRGQGFSTCLLDVSAFPVGSYRIKWHGCCINNRGRYWSLLPLNSGPVFTVQNPTRVSR